MDDRTQPGRDDAPPTRSAPSAPSTDDNSRNGRTAAGGERSADADRRSSSSKPALTDRERSERWPVD